MSQMRVIQIRPNERLITVNREAGSRNVGYLCWHHHKILLIAAQSILRLASAINKLATSEVDKVSFQSLSLLVKGRIKAGHHKGYHIKQVSLNELPQLFAEERKNGYKKIRIVSTRQGENWNLVSDISEVKVPPAPTPS